MINSILEREWKGIAISLGAAMVISFLLYNSPYAMLLFGGINFFVRKVISKEEEKKTKLIMKGEFRAMTLSMSAALEGGTSVEKAMQSVGKEMQLLFGKDSKIVKGVGQIVRKIEANHPVEKAFEEMAYEMELEEAIVFAETFKIGKRIGGDMNRILMDVVEIISEKIQTEKEIENALASKKFEFRLMCIAPFTIIGYVRLTSPGYFNILYHNIKGICIMTFVLIFVLGAYEVGKRLILIET